MQARGPSLATVVALGCATLVVLAGIIAGIVVGVTQRGELGVAVPSECIGFADATSRVIEQCAPQRVPGTCSVTAECSTDRALFRANAIFESEPPILQCDIAFCETAQPGATCECIVDVCRRDRENSQEFDFVCARPDDLPPLPNLDDLVCGTFSNPGDVDELGDAGVCQFVEGAGSCSNSGDTCNFQGGLADDILRDGAVFSPDGIDPADLVSECVERSDAQCAATGLCDCTIPICSRTVNGEERVFECVAAP